jgi:hypothetical protein
MLKICIRKRGFVSMTPQKLPLPYRLGCLRRILFVRRLATLLKKFSESSENDHSGKPRGRYGWNVIQRIVFRTQISYWT